MIHFAIFYTTFYLFTRFRIAYPEASITEEDSDKNEVLRWFAIWPVAVELFTFAWLSLEFYDYLTREKTSAEE
jgi:hypothetical protein